jgi:hypothetical protein
MIDPHLPDLPDDIRAMLHAERQLVPLPPEMRARLATSVARASSGAAWLTPALTAVRRAALFAVTFVVGVGVGAVLEHRHDASSGATGAVTSFVAPAPLSPVTPGPSASAVVEVAPPQWHEVVALVPERRSTEPPDRSPMPRALPVSTLARERAQLETAREAMARSRWEEAAAALDAHERDTPAGQLTEERDSLRVALLVHEGRASDARAAAARFEGLHPESLFLSAVRAEVNSVTDMRDAGQALHQGR